MFTLPPLIKFSIVLVPINEIFTNLTRLTDVATVYSAPTNTACPITVPPLFFKPTLVAPVKLESINACVINPLLGELSTNSEPLPSVGIVELFINSTVLGLFIST